MLLSSVTPINFKTLIGKASHSNVNKILPFYINASEEEQRKIWNLSKKTKVDKESNELAVDEIVEDAGFRS